MDNTNDPTSRATLRYKKHPSITVINDKCKGRCFEFQHSWCDWNLKRNFETKLKKSSQNYDIPTRVIIENADIFSDILCNNFNSFIESSNLPPVLQLAKITTLHKRWKHCKGEL